MEKFKFYFKEFAVFVFQEARACVFAGSFLFLLIITNYVHLPFIGRADFLFLAAILIQVIMIVTKLETIDEAKTILLFHVIGLVLELYKTHPNIGSWVYLDLGFFHIATVPLYSGFMYASIGSYIVQSWRIFKLQLKNPPPYAISLVLSILIYANFFTNHFLPDVRWFLILFVLVVFWKTKIEYTVRTMARRMPVALSFVLIAFFIWIAENIGTFTGAWQYPYQVTAWSAVSFHKVSSWSLLVILSFILIAYLKHVKEQRKEKEIVVNIYTLK